MMLHGRLWWDIGTVVMQTRRLIMVLQHDGGDVNGKEGGQDEAMLV